MLKKNDCRDDDLLIRFDEITEKLRRHAKTHNIDLSKIRIRNKECEKIQRRYMFYN